MLGVNTQYSGLHQGQAIAGSTGLFKRFMNLKIIQIFLALLLAGYMGLVRRTTRWTTDNLDVVEPLQESGKGFVACTWHARFLMTTAGWTKMRQVPHVLISRSRDGNLVAYTSKILRLGVIRGSRRSKLTAKSKGGANALREMLTTIENGDCIFMTPDGPRGPRMRMGEGPLRLAKLSGAPVIAYALSTSNKIMFNSWDRFMLPLPFGKGKIVFGGPVYVDAEATDKQLEAARLELEEIMNTCSQTADEAVGNDPIRPKPIQVN
ncbi:MAG: lysophospholipid acyltransferase family protein [Hyphomonadaceae bacterium]|nr:lysophospholipid acyltransferase family protein [Hyphomonadaceae bacterium]